MAYTPVPLPQRETLDCAVFSKPLWKPLSLFTPAVSMKWDQIAAHISSIWIFLISLLVPAPSLIALPT